MIDVHTNNIPVDESAFALTSLLKKYQKEDVLILFSGGSSLAIVDHLDPKFLNKKHTITVLDERFSTDSTKGNFSKLERTTFFKHAIENGAQYIDTRPQNGESLDETAKRFDLALKHWHVLHRDGIVIATVGVGPDGHTSGILPMPENTEAFEKLFQNKNKCAVGYTTTPEKNPHTERITTTLTYLTRHIDHAIIFATGIQKKEALQNMVSGTIDIPRSPSQSLRQVKDAQLFTDLKLE